MDEATKSSTGAGASDSGSANTSANNNTATKTSSVVKGQQNASENHHQSSNQTQQQPQQQYHTTDVNPVPGGVPYTVGAEGNAVAHGPDGGTWLCCVLCHWLRSNNSVHKASLSIATLLVMSLLVASPVLFLISSVPGSEQGTVNRECYGQLQEECVAGTLGSGSVNTGSTCDTAACRAAAARLLAAMDQRAAPCQDFYRFACGGWPASPVGIVDTVDMDVNSFGATGLFSFYTLQRHVNAQIQNLLTYNTSEYPFQKLGQFYNSCLRARNKAVDMAPMYSLLDELGGYLPPGSLGPADLTPLIGRLLRLNGAPLIDVYVDRDLEDNSRAAVFIDIPKPKGAFPLLLEFPQIWEPFFYSVRTKRQSPQEASKAYIYMKESVEEKRLLQLEKILQGFLPMKMVPQQRAKESQNILLFANILTKLYPRTKEVVFQFQKKDSYQLYNVSKLQTEFTFINWERLLSDVLAWNTTEQNVYVMSSTYLTSLDEMITKFQKRVIHNALLLIFARDTLMDLVNTTMRSSTEWPVFCTRLVIGAFSQAVGALYVKQYPSYYLKHLTEEISAVWETLKRTIAGRIRAAAWLDESTKSAALLKLAHIRGQFVTWPQLSNMTYVADTLKDVEIDMDDFFHNTISRFKQIRTISPNTYDMTLSNKSWAFPFIVNAFYEPRDNVIVIPLALLVQPHFRDDVPSYAAYASVGNVAAHEALHAFDVTRGETWLSSTARLGLEARADCVARQYARAFHRRVHFKGSNIDVQFDWNITRNENMADIGGLQTAYHAWKSVALGITTDGSDGASLIQQRLPGVTLGPRQLFFVTAAQMYCAPLSAEMYIMSVETDFHSPHPERVNGIMMNSPSFAEAFNCPLGSKMNPAKKCSTW